MLLILGDLVGDLGSSTVGCCSGGSKDLLRLGFVVCVARKVASELRLDLIGSLLGEGNNGSDGESFSGKSVLRTVIDLVIVSESISTSVLGDVILEAFEAVLPSASSSEPADHVSFIVA
jgi:hypothetical protein